MKDCSVSKVLPLFLNNVNDFLRNFDLFLFRCEWQKNQKAKNRKKYEKENQQRNYEKLREKKDEKERRKNETRNKLKSGTF